MKNQTEIEFGRVNEPHPGSKNLCEWCGADSTVGVEIKRKAGKRTARVPTGLFIYACDRHKHIAEEVAHPGEEKGEAA